MTGIYRGKDAQCGYWVWLRFNPKTGTLQIKDDWGGVFTVETHPKEMRKNLGKSVVRRLLASLRDGQGFHKFTYKEGDKQ